MRTSFLLGSVGLVAVLGLAGCAADNEPEGGDLAQRPLSAGGPAVGTPQPSQDRFSKSDTSYPSVGGGEAGFTCRQGAFCDAFASGGIADIWNGSYTTGDGMIEQQGDSASLGSGSLHLTSRDKNSSAYLLREKDVVAKQWSGSLGFAIRFPKLPTEYVGGPELAVKTPEGPVYVRVFATPDGLFLEQNGSAGCAADRCVGTRTLISSVRANHWYNVVVGFEVNENTSAPYGLVETSVNGGEFVTTDLNVPLADSTLYLKAGITQGDPGNYASLDLDNVSLLAR